MKVSIIIPAFKVERYIEKCIRSLEVQDIPKNTYEIIVTNDGSPDNVKGVVENLQKEFSNIVLINQENQGVSMARNNAIAIAKGKYILPIDPDDYVNPNTLKRILELADKNQIDVLYLGFEIFDIAGNSTWKTNYKIKENKFFSGVEGYFEARGYTIKDPDRSWAILYRKSMLNQFEIYYPRDVPFLEDGLFLTKVFAVANRVQFDDTIFYQRTTRLGSATNSSLFYSEKTISGFILAVQDIKKFALKNNLNLEQIKLVNHTIAKFVILALSPSMATFNFKSYYRVIRILKQAGLNKLKTDGLRFLYKKHIKIYNISKLFFPIYFRLSNK